MIGLPRSPRTRRRWAVAAAVVAVVAVLIAGVGLIGFLRSRPVPDEARRDAVLSATRDAVTALMTFAPGMSAADRSRVEGRLTGPLLLSYRSAGPDVVLPGAVENDATMSVRVVGVGVRTYTDHDAQVIVFADQTIRLPAPAATAPTSGSVVGVARWAGLRKVGGNWRLAELDPIGAAG